MIKVIFVENNEIKMSKAEFEKLLEETYKRGKDENYESAYNRGYRDGYCRNHWFGGSSITATNTDLTINKPNPLLDNVVYCGSSAADNAISSKKGE